MSEATAPGRLRILVVDDEPVARRGARRIVESRPDWEVVGECRNGAEAVAAIRTLTPDVVLLDVQMPGKSGFDVIRDVGVDAMPAVVFVTAYDEHAVRAFEAQAVDYVVKPYTDDRLLAAVERARVRGHERRAAELQEQLRSLLHAAPLPPSSAHAPGASPPAPAAAPRPYLERLLVTVGGRSVVVDVDDVTWIRADDYCVTVFTTRSSHVMRESLTHLAERLDPATFIRVHRSALVRLAAVRTLDRSASGQTTVVLRDGTRVPISRSRREAILEALGAVRG